uniref:Uncharacterized protein n=1 Tax=Candidatus Kentrum sp. FW TaxID=2126338 RepID=A0A450TWU1_9GAMM|nr:MAG: hypothetical protein BECKFW1821C_GA0114237_105217 [Candidatus Kentron sp. FW]
MTQIKISRSQIGFADLLRTLRVLDITDKDQLSNVMNCLGFSERNPNPVESVRGIHGGTKISKTQSHPVWTDSLTSSVPDSSLSGLESKDQPLPTILESLPPLEPKSEPPHWLFDVHSEVQAPLPLPRTPIFPHHVVRGLLTAAMTTRRAEASPDIPRLVREYVRGRLPQWLPFRFRLSLHRGVQLLLDITEGMTPWFDDMADLVTALGGLLAPDQCPIYEFEGSPLGAVQCSDDGTERPWQPQPRRPILIATDFGRGVPRNSRPRTGNGVWQSFARKTEEAHCPVVIINPFGPFYWPRDLSRRFTIIHWSPSIRASAIRCQVGPRHKVLP